ncbi:MAG: hypothetical protein FWE74_02275 [Oscillospiraceae bacterium]|nr:hypothetical protein [Oscillospiraceae bacterium]
MKKKILSALLAVVICFSAFSFTAVADEAGAKSRADLQDLVGGFSASWLDNDLYEYGTASFERFETAFDLAKAVLADSDAESADITVAYILLEAAFDNLLKKTQAELTALMAEVRPTYNRNNVFNADEDAIFEEDGFLSFTLAYDEADGSRDDDSNVITDLWTDLDSAFNDLERKQVVTRNELNNLDRARSRIEDEKFTSERRGTVTLGGEKFSTIRDTTWSGHWYHAGALPLNWGYLFTGTESTNYGIQMPWDPDGEFQAIRSGGWWQFFLPFNVADALFEAEFGNFGDKGVTSTTDDDIVFAYNRMRDTVAVINSFTADNTGRTNERAINNALNAAWDNIVTVENVHNASDSSLARADGRQGKGALAALYAEISGWDAPLTVNNTNVPTRSAEESIVVASVSGSYANGRFIRVGDDAASNETSVRLRRNSPIDLTNRVAINARPGAVAAAHVINYADLLAAFPLKANGATVGMPLLADAIRDIQLALDAGKSVLTSDENDFVLEARLLTYALADADFSDDKTPRARLETLVESSFAIDEITTPFFKEQFDFVRAARGSGASDSFKHPDCGECNEFIGGAGIVLRENRNTSNADRRNEVDQRRYAPFFDQLNDAIDDFNDEFKRWPVAINDGELSVYEILVAAAGATDEKIIELRTALALALLTEEGVEDQPVPDDFPLFNDNGSMNADARLQQLDEDGNPDPWDSWTAYDALKTALGFGVGSYALGDVNGDGAVTTADALEILKYIAGLESTITDNPQALVAASITADAPTTACALAILRFVAELIDTLDGLK